MQGKNVFQQHAEKTSKNKLILVNQDPQLRKKFAGKTLTDLAVLLGISPQDVFIGKTINKTGTEIHRLLIKKGGMTYVFNLSAGLAEMYVSGELDTDTLLDCLMREFVYDRAVTQRNPDGNVVNVLDPETGAQIFEKISSLNFGKPAGVLDIGDMVQMFQADAAAAVDIAQPTIGAATAAEPAVVQ